MSKNKESGKFICNTSCVCGVSSDGMSVYLKDDPLEGKRLDAYCRSGFCERSNPYISPNELEEAGVDIESIDKRKLEQESQPVDFTEIEALDFRGWKDRRITKSISEKYGVHTLCTEDGTVLKRCYPEYNQECVLSGYSVRLTQPQKDFFKKGSCKVSNMMFGQQLFQSGGKYLVITTGQEDALAVAQVLQYEKNGVKYDTPVVSVTSGDGSALAQIKANFRFVNSFDKVVFMFDEDESGQKFVKDCAGLLSPGKAHIAKLPPNCKDPCEALQKGLGGELKASFWKAERYSPASIVGSASTWDALVQRAKWEKISLPPFATQLQEMLGGGPALGEITTLAGGSSIGKTAVVNRFLYHWIMNTDYKVGVIPLESDIGELVENLLSIHIGIKLANMNDEEKLEFYSTTQAIEHHKQFTQLPDGSDRFLIVDHNGDVADDRLKDQMEFLVASGCKITILDPMTLALSGEGNEGVDEFMSWLLRFVKNKMVSHINICHVRKNTNGTQANSRGAEISEESIKGCLPFETEFLTPDGWKRIGEYEKGDLVGQWDNGVMMFVEPTDYIKLPCDQMYRVYNHNTVDMVFSEEHRIPLYNKNGELVVLRGEELFNSLGRYSVPFSFTPNCDGFVLTEQDELILRIKIMLAADGCYHGNGLCKIGFKKERKITRCRELLVKAGITFSETRCNGYTIFRLRALTESKHLDKCHNWYSASAAELKVLVDECTFWDGGRNKKRGDYFCTTKRPEADVVQFACNASGIRACLREYPYKHGTYYQVSIPREGSYKNKVMIRTDTTKKEVVKTTDGFKYCFTVASSFFVVRNNNRIFVTGNSGSIFQVSMNNVLLMRDKIADNPIIRNTTKVVLSKARRTGNTGVAGYWLYDNKTADFTIGKSPEEIEESGEDGFNEDEELFGKAGAYDNTDPNSLLKQNEDRF